MEKGILGFQPSKYNWLNRHGQLTSEIEVNICQTRLTDLEYCGLTMNSFAYLHWTLAYLGVSVADHVSDMASSIDICRFWSRESWR